VTLDDEFQRVYGGGADESVSGEEFCSMLALSNFFDHPQNAVEYRSLNHIARRFEQSINPSKTLKRLLSKMLRLKFFFINQRDMIEFDGRRFDKFVDESKYGGVVWEYLGNRATYLRHR